MLQLLWGIVTKNFMEFICIIVVYVLYFKYKIVGRRSHYTAQTGNRGDYIERNKMDNTNPVHRFISDWFEINKEDDIIIWITGIADMNKYYKEYCETFNVHPLPLNQFTKSMMIIEGIKKDGRNKKDRFGWGRVRGWVGIRRIGASGNVNDIK